jgi:hemoglobin
MPSVSKAEPEFNFMMNDDTYREGDAAYQAAGGYEGLKKLTDDFYQLMDRDPEFQGIRDLHHETMADAAEKLALFFCGYFNGPDLFSEKYGPFRLAAFHQRIPIGSAERDAWLACMQRVLDQQPWETAFKEHVFQRLQTPAERCRTLP